MISISNDLNRLITILDYKASLNEFGAREHKYEIVKKIHAKVIPLSKKTSTINNESEQLASLYKFIIRAKALATLSENYIIELDKKRYKVDYFNIDFKNNEYIEIFASRTEQI